MDKREKRRAKIRRIIKGTKERPRLVVFRSNRYIYGQVIDDVKKETLASIERMADAADAGRQLAKRAGAKKIKRVIFDRAGYKYHGRIKAFAEGAREAGLRF